MKKVTRRDTRRVVELTSRSLRGTNRAMHTGFARHLPNPSEGPATTSVLRHQNFTPEIELPVAFNMNVGPVNCYVSAPTIFLSWRPPYRPNDLHNLL